MHEAIISEEVWQAAQVKLLAQAKKYEHVNKGKDTRTHLLSGIVKCPICGAGMYGNKCIKHKKDGTKYKDFYYYGCKHRTMTRGHKCEYRKQIREELLDDAVTEVIVALVSKPKFASMMQEKINMKVDTSMLDQEIANHEKQLRQFYSMVVDTAYVCNICSYKSFDCFWCACFDFSDSRSCISNTNHAQQTRSKNTRMII